MSNHLAIATVTVTLGELLAHAARVVPIAEVTHLFPGTQAMPAAGINIYLYKVSLNQALRNPDLPARNPDLRVGQRTQVALDLCYLLSFTGDEASLEPQRLLGAAVALLHANPLLSREAIQSTIRLAVAGDPAHFLATSDLADQVERVQFTPLSLSLEDMSRLWQGFFQVPYRLSVAYQASAVLIESLVNDGIDGRVDSSLLDSLKNR